MNIERSLLNILIHNPEKFELVDKYNDIFTLSETRKLYKIIQTLVKQNGSFTMKSILDFIENDKHFSVDEFMKITDSFEYDDWKLQTYLNQLLLKKVKTDLKQYTLEVINNDYTDIIQVKTELEKIKDSIYIHDETTIKKADQVCRETLENLYPRKIYSGDEYIDDNQGGYSEDELIFLAARPGDGKTKRCLHLICKQLKKNMRIGLITAEMGEKKIMRFLACQIAGIDSNYLDRNMLNKQCEAKLEKAFEWIYEKELYIDSCGIYEDILQKIKIMKNKYGIECVYVDHLHHLISNKTYFSTVHMLSEMAKGFKRSNMDLLIPHVILAQLHRSDTPEKRPTQSDFKGSGKIEELADIAILMHCQQKAIDGDKSRRAIEFIYDKNRSGKVGDRKEVFCVDTGRYERWKGSF